LVDLVVPYALSTGSLERWCSVEELEFGPEFDELEPDNIVSLVLIEDVRPRVDIWYTVDPNGGPWEIEGFPEVIGDSRIDGKAGRAPP